jgi:hypothetical protein
VGLEGHDAFFEGNGLPISSQDDGGQLDVLAGQAFVTLIADT